jgi:hypothetical protein
MTDHFNLVPIPNSDGELPQLCAWLEEVMLNLAGDDGDSDYLLEEFGGRAALEAVQTVAELVAAAECHGRSTMPVAPDGRFELIPIGWAHLHVGDVAILDDLIQHLADHPEVARARDVYSLTDRGVPPLERLCRLATWLAKPADNDVDLLYRALPEVAGRVVLDNDAFGAYRRLTDRAVSVIWNGDPLVRWLFRGA